MIERLVDVYPSRDWRRPKPARDYGITTVSMTFTLKGDGKAVYWEIGSEWAIKPVREHLARFRYRVREQYHAPTGRRLGYHSPTPHYESQQVSEECEILNGRCYTDCSFCDSDLLIEGFLAGGTEWLWPKLEEYYRHIFADAPFPNFSAYYLPHPDDKTAESRNG